MDPYMGYDPVLDMGFNMMWMTQQNNLMLMGAAMAMGASTWAFVFFDLDAEDVGCLALIAGVVGAISLIVGLLIW